MYRKTQEEIHYITECGKRMGKILDDLVRMAAPGISAWEIDEEAERMIRSVGGVPAFKGYAGRPTDPPFPGTICASLNTELVHAIPTKEKILRKHDVFTIDIGMQYPLGCGLGKNGNGFFVDTAVTFSIGDVPKEVEDLIQVTHDALEVGISAAGTSHTVADIGRAVENFILPHGYGIVRDLVGHGVGHDVHEEPRVPNFYDEQLEQWKLEPGVVIAIEPMITLGSHEIETAPDGWTIFTKDRKLSAHFEHTVVITDTGPVVVTRRPSER